MGELCSDVTIFRASFQEDSSLSHTLLLQAASCYSGLPAVQLGSLEINPWGKPSFSKRPQLHFSITHSGHWWLCGFADQPIGLDLQVHRTHAAPERLSQRFFHPREDAFLAEEDYSRFFDLWCAKESWVKYTGRGFYDGTESFSVVSLAGEFPAVEGAQLRLIPFDAEYSLCLCAKALGEIRILPLCP